MNKTRKLTEREWEEDRERRARLSFERQKLRVYIHSFFDDDLELPPSNYLLPNSIRS